MYKIDFKRGGYIEKKAYWTENSINGMKYMLCKF